MWPSVQSLGSLGRLGSVSVLSLAGYGVWTGHRTALRLSVHIGKVVTNLILTWENDCQQEGGNTSCKTQYNKLQNMYIIKDSLVTGDMGWNSTVIKEFPYACVCDTIISGKPVLLISTQQIDNSLFTSY